MFIFKIRYGFIVKIFSMRSGGMLAVKSQLLHFLASAFQINKPYATVLYSLYKIHMTVFLLSKQAKSTFIKSWSKSILLSLHRYTSYNTIMSQESLVRKDKFTLQPLSKSSESFERHILVKLCHSFNKVMETERDLNGHIMQASVLKYSFPFKVKFPLQ